MESCCLEKARRRLGPLPTPGSNFTYPPTHGMWPIKAAVLLVCNIRKRRRLPRREEGLSPHPCFDEFPNTIGITLANHVRAATQAEEQTHSRWEIQLRKKTGHYSRHVCHNIKPGQEEVNVGTSRATKNEANAK